MVGKCQQQILDRLPSTINALIAAIDPARPQAVHDALKRLVAGGVVEVAGRTGKHSLSAWVTLAEPARARHREAPIRAAAAELMALMERLR